MKIRTGYVSNSSSSSFVIAYDESLFGDLNEFLKKSYIGCETCVKSSSDMDEFYRIYCDTEDEKDLFKSKISVAEKNGKKVIYLKIDQDFEVVVSLLKHIGNNCVDKIEFIYGGGDY